MRALLQTKCGGCAKKFSGRNTEICDVIISLTYASVYVAALVQQLCVWSKGSCGERTNCAVCGSGEAIVWTLEAGGVKKRGLGVSWLG